MKIMSICAVFFPLFLSFSHAGQYSDNPIHEKIAREAVDRSNELEAALGKLAAKRNSECEDCNRIYFKFERECMSEYSNAMGDQAQSMAIAMRNDLSPDQKLQMIMSLAAQQQQQVVKKYAAQADRITSKTLCGKECRAQKFFPDTAIQGTPVPETTIQAAPKLHFRKTYSGDINMLAGTGAGDERYPISIVSGIAATKYDVTVEAYGDADGNVYGGCFRIEVKFPVMPSDDANLLGTSLRVTAQSGNLQFAEGEWDYKNKILVQTLKPGSGFTLNKSGDTPFTLNLWPGKGSASLSRMVINDSMPAFK